MAQWKHFYRIPEQLRWAGTVGSTWPNPCQSRKPTAGCPVWVAFADLKGGDSQPLWPTCASAQPPTEHRIIKSFSLEKILMIVKSSHHPDTGKLVLGGTSSTPFCARCLSSWHWALLKRAWLLCSFCTLFRHLFTLTRSLLSLLFSVLTVSSSFSHSSCEGCSGPFFMALCCPVANSLYNVRVLDARTGRIDDKPSILFHALLVCFPAIHGE